MAKVNFLLGKAERLVRKIEPPKIKPEKVHPYEFGSSQKRVAPMLKATAEALAKLPAKACPNDESVALVTLHPAYLAKSYFPDALLAEAGLRAVGSRQRIVAPKAWAIKNPPEQAVSAELFVAGRRANFDQLAIRVPKWTATARGADDLRKIEEVREYAASEKVRTAKTKTDFPFWETILHATDQPESDFILEGFREFLADLEIELDLDERLHAEVDPNCWTVLGLG